jgi:Recombinase
VVKLFEWCASGGISLKEAAKKVQAAGLVYAKSGAKVPVSAVHTILRNRLYAGQFEWNGKLKQGKHESIVSIDLWERVQGRLRQPLCAASGTGAERPKAVRKAGTARKTPPSQFRAIELHLGGWRSGRQFPPTL